MDQKNLKITWATTGMLGSAMHLAKKTNNSLRCGSNGSRLLDLLNVSDGDLLEKLGTTAAFGGLLGQNSLHTFPILS